MTGFWEKKLIGRIMNSCHKVGITGQSSIRTT